MKTTATSESHRMSPMEYKFYEDILAKQEARKASERDAQRRQSEEELTASFQNNIKCSCNDLMCGYHKMVRCGKNYEGLEIKKKSIQMEELNFYKHADSKYTYHNIDPAISRKMHALKIGYYILPFTDCLLVFFALIPIMTSKVVSSDVLNPNAATATSIILSIMFGCLLSLPSRFGVFAWRKDIPVSRKALKAMAITICISALPLIYLVGYVCFRDEETADWAYFAVFGFISLGIQVLMVSSSEEMAGAVEYCRKERENENTKARYNGDRISILDDIKSIEENMQKNIESFINEYNKFTTNFRNLAAARNEHIEKFGKEPNLYLSQLCIHFGNIQCFGWVEIPYHAESDGKISARPFLNFPDVSGNQDIVKTNELLYLQFMIEKAHTGTSIAETIRTAERQARHEQTSTGFDNNVQPPHTERRSEENEEEQEDATANGEDFPDEATENDELF